MIPKTCTQNKHDCLWWWVRRRCLSESGPSRCSCISFAIISVQKNVFLIQYSTSENYSGCCSAPEQSGSEREGKAKGNERTGMFICAELMGRIWLDAWLTHRERERKRERKHFLAASHVTNSAGDGFTWRHQCSSSSPRCCHGHDL